MALANEVLDKVKEANDVKVDIEKAKKAGHDAAKDIFGDEYDKEKADATVNGMAKKMKDGTLKPKDTEDAIQIMVNAFRSE